jgi:hypothetical protein
VKALGLT